MLAYSSAHLMVRAYDREEMKSGITAGRRAELLKLAREAAGRAYAPYSRFRVGAAVLGQERIYSGANVENASSGLGLCAERAALAAAVNAGERSIWAVAVACIDAKGDGPQGARMPCGACRQWLAELASEAVVWVDQVEKEFSVEELMPAPFILAATNEKP